MIAEQETIEVDGHAKEGRRFSVDLRVATPAAAVLAVLALHAGMLDRQRPVSSGSLSAALAGGTAIYILALGCSWLFPSLRKRLTINAPLIAAFFLLIGLWDLATAKLALLPLPYFPGPDRVLDALITDRAILLTSVYYSLRLLVLGYLLGSLAGLLTGVALGWNRRVHYWLMPVLKIVGPIPATAWIPIVLVVFPTSFSASVFLIFLAVWFPVSIMTSSGIAAVPTSYFEVSRTLGARRRFLIAHIALPAALPNIFVGLFMGLGTSFVTLVVAEMLGVKAGLGWYITWANGWAEYAKVYAALAIIALVFSGLISLLFRLRDRFLVWQKGLMGW